MEILSIKNLTFKYPETEKIILDNIDLTVNKGEFVTLCGKSGCGKTTLLRHFKPAIAPHGEKSGSINFCEKDINTVSEREQCKKIGFVQQRPDNQIVTDKVWHELAFGLENLGVKTDEIRTKVAEMASFFGIQKWFHMNVNELSGGQKQLLNLASVMVMQPDIIILDEPTAQLDPIAAVNFLETVAKINRELGTTVIITEHRLEEVFPMSDRIIVMENGKILADGKPNEIGFKLKGNPMFEALPTPLKVYHATTEYGECPVTIREGRAWLENINHKNKLTYSNTVENRNVAVELKDIYFRYEKENPDILKSLNLKINQGEIYAIVGGNGMGKSTVLSVIGNLIKPYRGKVIFKGKNINKDREFRRRVAILPQDPQTIFSQNTVKKELKEMCCSEDDINNIAKKCDITHILSQHPYDLSGGEQQRLALAKILLLKPELLLLDEPTKGFDSHFKSRFADILKSLKNDGITIVLVSHDIEFCAKYADRCAMLFDGNITSEGYSREFFSGKSFYTTAANRMARNIINGAVLTEDIIKSIME